MGRVFLLICCLFCILSSPQKRAIAEYSDGVKLYKLKPLCDRYLDTLPLMGVSLETRSGILMEGFIVSDGLSPDDIIQAPEFNFPFLWAVTTFPDGRKTAQYLMNEEGWKATGSAPEGTYWWGYASYSFNRDGTGCRTVKSTCRNLAQQIPVSESDYSWRGKSGLIYHNTAIQITGGYYYFLNAYAKNNFNWKIEGDIFRMSFFDPTVKVSAEIDYNTLAPDTDKTYAAAIKKQWRADFPHNKEVAQSKKEISAEAYETALKKSTVEFDLVGSNDSIIVLVKKGKDKCNLDNYIILYKEDAEVLALPVLNYSTSTSANPFF